MPLTELVTATSDSPEKPRVKYFKISKTHLADTKEEWGTMEWYVDRDAGYINSQVRFRDCFGKPVCLEFYVSQFKHVSERVAKIDHMIKELQDFKAAYLEAIKAAPLQR